MKTVLITRANSGIGKATFTFSATECDDVVFIAQDLQRAEAVKIGLSIN